MTVQFTLNGRRVEAAEGSSLLDVARREGVDVPTLCHLENHRNGVCRLCLVETDASGRVVPSCSTPVRDGMDVRTDTPHLRELRTSLLCLLREDHGHHEGAHACELERLADRYGVRANDTSNGRLRPVDRSHPAITFDPDLCILCRKCVIACQEDQVHGVVSLASTGTDTRIVFDGGNVLGESSCASCGACVDVCPTDALQEVGWQPAERTVRTTCPYCGVGCTVEYGVAQGRIVWARGVRGQGVNDGMLCVKGKFAFEHESSPERLQHPLVRIASVPRGPLGSRPAGAVFREASWEEALSLIAGKMQTLLATHGPSVFGGIACDRSTNEDIYAFQRLFRTAIGTNNLDASATLCHAPSAAMLSWALGTGASTNPIADLHAARTILVVGSSTERAHPVIAAHVKEAVRAGAHLVVVDPRLPELGRLAEHLLLLAPGTDVPLFSAMARYVLDQGWEDREFIAARTEGFEEWRQGLAPYTVEYAAQVTGVSADLIREVARLYATEKPSTILWSLGITEHSFGTDDVSALVNLALLTGNVGVPGSGLNPLRGQNNVQGAVDVGATSQNLPGYQSLTDAGVRQTFSRAWGTEVPRSPGLRSTEMIPAAIAGSVKFLYLVGENSLLSHPDPRGVDRALQSLDFLVVQDLFLTETAEYADVVLPAASSYEQSGTFTNTERRVQRVRPLLPPPGEARPDWEVFAELSARLGRPMPFETSADIMDELARVVPSYSGLSHARLERGGIQWPVTPERPEGTPRMHEKAFVRGRARFRPVSWAPIPVDPEYPYVLITGRQREQYHTGTMTRRSRVVTAVTEGPVVEMHPEDLRKEGVRPGDRVGLVGRGVAVTLRTVANSGLRRGVLFTTFHYREAPVNLLVPPTHDPITKTPGYKDARVRVERVGPRRAGS